MSPRPRSSESAVIRATLDLIAEHGVTAVTVDAVADRSGVSRPTIYRRWGSRDSLIRAAYARMLRSLVEMDTGSVRGDLLALLRQLVAYLNRVRVFPSLMEAAARDPELAAMSEQAERRTRAIYERVLRRGVERGELPAGVDVLLFTELVVSPFVYRRVVSRDEIDPASIEPVVDAVLAAFGRIPARPRQQDVHTV
ncbi:TetR/AcrR family transcriptional regulator [Actinomadura rugatobispora]|uniref:TetR/AcrR family transcriptional regulator n=1 Tax=Actinomadura rugatobispora TaxID=1994 RepID=A0ABW0ZZQ4_9ACTN|nr:TetR/AcrR family transcriptional regulator [Actinomadura rugatobispora]